MEKDDHISHTDGKYSVTKVFVCLFYVIKYTTVKLLFQFFSNPHWIYHKKI